MSLLIKKILNKIKTFDTDIKSLNNSKMNNTQTYDADLNNLKTPGTYYCSGNVQNIPSTGYSYYVTVIANPYSDYVLQQAVRVTQTVANIKIQQRQCFNGTWTAWTS